MKMCPWITLMVLFIRSVPQLTRRPRGCHDFSPWFALPAPDVMWRGSGRESGNNTAAESHREGKVWTSLTSIRLFGQDWQCRISWQDKMWLEKLKLLPLFRVHDATQLKSLALPATSRRSDRLSRFRRDSEFVASDLLSVCALDMAKIASRRRSRTCIVVVCQKR